MARQRGYSEAVRRRTTAAARASASNAAPTSAGPLDRPVGGDWPRGGAAAPDAPTFNASDAHAYPVP